jgi:endonuclease-3
VPSVANHAEAVARALVAAYGRPRLGNKRRPFRELLYIMLSARTTPGSYRRTFAAVHDVAPRADMLASIPLRELEIALVPGGLARKRARQIRDLARELRQRWGRVTLAPLARMGDAEVEAALVGLPGVGIKTARCVMMYALDRAVFPVDEHCLRVCRRLGWTDATRVTPGVANALQGAIPASVRHDLHVGMVVLGRDVCRPKRPSCRQCPVLEWCTFGTAEAARYVSPAPGTTS